MTDTFSGGQLGMEWQKLESSRILEAIPRHNHATATSVFSCSSNDVKYLTIKTEGSRAQNGNRKDSEKVKKLLELYKFYKWSVSTTDLLTQRSPAWCQRAQVWPWQVSFRGRGRTRQTVTLKSVPCFWKGAVSRSSPSVCENRPAVLSLACPSTSWLASASGSTCVDFYPPPPPNKCDVKMSESWLCPNQTSGGCFYCLRSIVCLFWTHALQTFTSFRKTCKIEGLSFSLRPCLQTCIWSLWLPYNPQAELSCLMM